MLSAAVSVADPSSWLEQEAASAPWCVVLGRPAPDVLKQVQRCAGQILVVVPDLETQEGLEQLIHPLPERLQWRVASVGPEAAEVDWWLFNDSRFNGPLPLEHWLPAYPNLRLVGQERRQQLPLAELLNDHLAAQQRGVLVVVDEPAGCVASLAGLGSKGERIAALVVLPMRSGIEQAALEEVLAPSACLKAIPHDGEGLFWRFDVNQRLALVEAERDALASRLEQINAELDQILALIDDASQGESASD